MERDIDQAAALDRSAHQGGDALEPLEQSVADLERLDPGEVGRVDAEDRAADRRESEALGDAADQGRGRVRGQTGGDSREAVDPGDDDRRAGRDRRRRQRLEIGKPGRLVDEGLVEIALEGERGG